MIDETTLSTGITPGGWQHTGDSPKFDDVKPRESTVNGGFIVARCYGPDRHHNARTIAAVPKLIEALKSVPITCNHSYVHANACYCCIVRQTLNLITN